MRSAAWRPDRRQLRERIHPAVRIHAAGVLAVVVTVGHQHHRAAGGAGGLGIVAGVAHHQGARRLGAQGLAGFAQGQRVGFLALKAVAAEHMLEIPRQPLGVQQVHRKRVRLVGQTGQAQATRTQRLQTLVRTGVHLGTLAVDGAVVCLVTSPGLRKQCFDFDSALRFIHGRQHMIEH